MPSALAAREKGLALVNIAQPFKSSGMMLTCLKESGIATPADFADKTLGVWFGGNEYPFLNWMSKLGLATDGSVGGVTVLKQGFNVDPLLQKQAACVSTMTYNEYWQVIDAGLTPEDLVVFKYEDEGVATLEDGLYVMEDSLTDPAKGQAGYVTGPQRWFWGWMFTPLMYAFQDPAKAGNEFVNEAWEVTINNEDNLAALQIKITPDDEDFVDSLVPPGEHSGKGFNDPLYPVLGRPKRDAQ